MGKCEKCGFMNPYWITDYRDVYRDYCKVEDYPPALEHPVKVIWEDTFFAYQRTEKYVRRLPLEIWRARGKFSRPRGYWDGSGNKAPFARKA